ncbi:DUF1573 domain-containing protein [Parabacteroides bouchesdurhonensis]|uniref:DUF1573 domain-containing protein n=1 Tax=Parabacteroides bouchesdurhonensis TaxID=1936995 RepID=UPI000C838333|nr:DUF1573 domain-containing protein [Parabacteroides bouchesdurhonensis]
MKCLNVILLLTVCFLSISCKDKKKEEITQLVTNWQDKEIIFPSNMVFTRYMIDTIDYQIPQSNYKVLIYVDSIGCASCKLQLPRWKEFIAQIDSLTNSQVPFLFFLHPKDYKEIRYILRRDGFDFPVCIDTEDALNKQNKFPANITFQTFLLDKDNKVVVIGNPVHNIAVKDLYLKQLLQGTHVADNSIKTTAEVNITEVNLGDIPAKETKKADFIVKNTGNSPLVILGTSTTCGCAVTTFDKHPAKPGESLHLTVSMTPKESGMFDEVIMVKCNTEKPIQLKIRGHAQ